MHNSLFKRAPDRPLLNGLIAASLATPVSEETLREQRISFAFGNMPQGSRSTKESVRRSAETLHLEALAG